jgi:hypothetical protein
VPRALSQKSRSRSILPGNRPGADNLALPLLCRIRDCVATLNDGRSVEDWRDWGVVNGWHHISTTSVNRTGMDERHAHARYVGQGYGVFLKEKKKLCRVTNVITHVGGSLIERGWPHHPQELGLPIRGVTVRRDALQSCPAGWNQLARRSGHPSRSLGPDGTYVLERELLWVTTRRTIKKCPNGWMPVSPHRVGQIRLQRAGVTLRNEGLLKRPGRAPIGNGWACPPPDWIPPQRL